LTCAPLCEVCAKLFRIGEVGPSACQLQDICRPLYKRPVAQKV